MCDEFIINKIQWMLFYFIHIIIIIRLSNLYVTLRIKKQNKKNLGF